MTNKETKAAEKRKYHREWQPGQHGSSTPGKIKAESCQAIAWRKSHMAQ